MIKTCTKFKSDKFYTDLWTSSWVLETARRDRY